ncbi:MAG TPA: hypothetical protein VHC47_06960 [Mucilaginibacter sp.]|nr:hypothetical protein [Mucilaginibacter sp.]
MMKRFFLLISLSAISLATYSQNKPVIFRSKKYTIYADKVVQGKNVATAVSRTQILSNYQSPSKAQISPLIEFKFSINGKDNEMPFGVNHHFLCTAGHNTTPVIQFGQPDKTQTKASGRLKPGTTLTIRLDMRNVLKAFKTQGYYICADGEKIYKDDFKGVFVAGGTAPLIWDFNNLVNHQGLQLKDPDGDGIYETNVTFEDNNRTASEWKLTKNIAVFPQYRSGYAISDAIYNMSLDEMQNAIEPDSTFRTGKEWAGVWTRDISYSIILSMAVLQPKVAMYSLMRKVTADGRIIQDTGTGGAYPVSSDRMIWAVAAWEVYKVTGDKAWLKKAYAIIRKSAGDDEKNVYDDATGLVRGESSFLDWREETYPKWMQPADIYESECLGTNAVHCRVNQVLAAMAGLLGDQESAVKYEGIAKKIQAGINRYLWMPEKGYYGQYRYGRVYQMLSPRSEALGEALTVYFEVANQKQAEVISHVPVNDFGIPCIYPQIPGIPPYHNNAVWPFVESYWALASAKAGNEASVLRAISAIYRPAALFATNKENFVASTGDYAGTQINSSNMLWSLSGNIAIVYKLFFGIHYDTESIRFEPFIPKALAGRRTLNNFRYRNALLDISMSGFGNRIKSVTLDGKPLPNATIPASLTGRHQVVIRLADNVTGEDKVGLKPGYTAPETPVAELKDGMLSWNKITGAVNYEVYRNGDLLARQNETDIKVPDDDFAEYQVASVDGNGVASFASEPVAIIPASSLQTLEMEDFAPKANLPYKGYSGIGFINISKTENTIVNIPVDIDKTGWYVVDFRYANGNGPINTDNKCAIRTLDADGQFAGTVVFPQRGKDEWSNWGYSNPVKIQLSRGKHTLTLQFKEANENMDGAINQAVLDQVRVIRLGN